MILSEKGRKAIVRKSEPDLNIIESKIDHSHKAEVLQIFPDARIYETNLTKKFRERKIYKRPDIQEIKSIIPGEVISLNISEGSYVTKGTHIMTFEAMKMHNIVLAPIDGTIQKIYVQVGQKVPKGVIMVFIKANQKLDNNDSSAYETSYISDGEDKISDDDLGLIV